jgi:5'-nucleotidase
VKLAIAELVRPRPQLVVSGVNSGQNAGINVLYSGTVAAAIEGAFFGITSVAVSLEFCEQARFDRAAQMARSVIEQVLEKKGPGPELYNLNIPTAAVERGTSEILVVPLCLARYGERYEKRVDPRGRNYYWATNEPPPPPSDEESDVTALKEGFITLTPLHFDLTKPNEVAAMKKWRFEPPRSL